MVTGGNSESMAARKRLRQRAPEHKVWRSPGAAMNDA